MASGHGAFGQKNHPCRARGPAEVEGRGKKRGTRITDSGRKRLCCKWDSGSDTGCRTACVFQKDLSAEQKMDLGGRLLAQQQPPSRRAMVSGPGKRGWWLGLKTGTSQPRHS